MRINKFGQITKDGEVELSIKQEEFMKTLLIDNKATSLSLRYGKAVANKAAFPTVIYDLEFNTLEEVFIFLDQLETSYSELDDHDLAYLNVLHYYFPYEI